MDHSKAAFFLALLWLNTACPAAGASVMRMAVDASGQVGKESPSANEIASTLHSMFNGEGPATDAATSNLLMLTSTKDPAASDLLPFVENLKSTIEPRAVEGQKTVNDAVASIQRCNEHMNQGMQSSSGAKNTCHAKGITHTADRNDECNKFTVKVDLTDKKDAAKKDKDTKCAAFAAVEEEVDTERAALNSVKDRGEFLDRVETMFCKDLIEKYRSHKEQCNSAKAAYDDVSAEQEKAVKAWTVQKTTADAVQGAMFTSCCTYAEETKDVCLVQDGCYDAKVEEYEKVKALIQAEEKVNKMEWRVYSRIECLLPLLGTEEAKGIEDCRTKTYGTDQLDIEYPAAPKKADCEVDTAYPGTPTYYNANFVSLPDTCKGHAVEMCPGMIPPTPEPTPAPTPVPTPVPTPRPTPAPTPGGLEFGIYDFSVHPGNGWNLVDTVQELRDRKNHFIEFYNKYGGIPAIKHWKSNNCCWTLSPGKRLYIDNAYIYPHDNHKTACNPSNGYQKEEVYKMWTGKGVQAALSGANTFTEGGNCQDNHNPAIYYRGVISTR